MKWSFVSCALATMSLSVTGGCALLSAPAPLTTLQIDLTPDALVWPAQLVPGRVTAATALQSDRVVVMDGAQVMQHGGLRWVSEPAVMMGEQLRRLRAPRNNLGAEAARGSAALELWLTDFSLHPDDSGSLVAEVSMIAEIRCLSGATGQPLPIASARREAEQEDAESIAAAFSASAREALAMTLAAVVPHAASCGLERAP